MTESMSIFSLVLQLRTEVLTLLVPAESSINTVDPEIKGFLQDRGCMWTFNAPHFAHIGDAWERMIGVAQRILEVLITLMAKVLAIINSTSEPHLNKCRQHTKYFHQ